MEITAFEHPRDYGEHFKARYEPTIAVQANARHTEREAEFNEALDRSADEWSLGTPDNARFEKGVPPRSRSGRWVSRKVVAGGG